MEQKNLRKTAGAPLYFGLAAMLLAVVNSVLTSGVSTASLNAAFASAGANLTMSPAIMAIFTAIGLVIYPGIFLILLLVSVNQPKRGTTFCVVWGILSGLSLLSDIYNLVLVATGANAKLVAITNQLIPGGFYLNVGLGFAANICVLVSCMVLFHRLHTFELPVSDDAAGQVNP